MRLIIMTVLFVVACVNFFPLVNVQGQEGKEDLPSLKTTLEYIERKMSESGKVCSQKIENGMTNFYFEQTFTIKELDESTISLKRVTSGWYMVKKPKQDNPFVYEPVKIDVSSVGSYSIKLRECDPDSITVKKVTENIAGLSFTKTTFELRFQTTDCVKTIPYEAKDFNVLKPSPKDIHKDTTHYVAINFTEEKLANAISKAIQHAIKKSGGKPSKTSIFEK